MPNGGAGIPITSRPAKTLVCFALAEEATPFRRAVSECSGIKVLVTGIGRQNAEHAFRTALAREKPDLVLSCGYAGGLDPALTWGTVVFAADNDSKLAGPLRAAGAKLARFHCSERVAATAAEKQMLRQSTGADAVEMESEVIRQIGCEHRVPGATVRVISDTADEDLPLDFNEFMAPDRKLNYRALVVALARAPGKIPELLRLQRRCRVCARNLAQALAKALNL